MRRRLAASLRIHAAGARTAATIPGRPTSAFHGRSSKAARICARRTTAAATGRLRAMRSRSTRPRAISAFGASGEEPLMHHIQEGDVMSHCILVNRPPNIGDSLRKTFRGLHTRSCAALVGAAALMSVSLAGPASAQAQQPPQQRPNIVVIMGDDIGIWNIGAYHRGMMAGRTPNLDKIAAEGMIFTDYYAEASCTAGRANFITGQLAIRTGMTTVGQAGSPIGLPAEAPTIAKALGSMGYATGQFGKNHLGDLNQFLPTVNGFDQFFGYLYHLDAMEDPA